MNNAKLIALLSEAKDAQKKFDAEGSYSRSPMWRIARGRAESAWGLLHDAILEAEHCTVLLESGESRTVGTIGDGFSLRSVASIENVEESKNASST